MAKILIADDDPDFVDASKIILEKEGHKILVAYTLLDAMKAIEKENPDLLIVDVMMEQPDDGIAMAQELRRKGNKIPIIMITSISKLTGMEYGKHESLVPVDEFQEKPIEPRKLIELVNKLLKRQGV
jgi:DNA-binding response OmpR family regulator